MLRNTEIEFKNCQIMKVHSRIAAFNNRLQIAEQLRNMTIDIGKNPITFVLDHKKRINISAS